MTRSDLEWRGLWHPTPPGRLRDELLGRAVIYFVTPLALALVFGQIRSLESFGHAYVGAFVLGASIGTGFELLYLLVWPALIRRKPSWTVRIAGHALTMAVAVTSGVLLASALGRAVLGSFDPDLTSVLVQGVVIASTILCILITTDETGARARASSRREAMHRMTAIRAELAALQARTDPHFLFNSLNTVAALIPDDPVLAETLLLRLSAVFRYALDAGRKVSVALGEEIAAVTAYLEIEALRIGPRLSWRLERDPGLDAVRVPPLVLQPLVENAIRHGAAARRGATEIVVTVRRRADDLVLTVVDQGSVDDVEPRSQTNGAGTALADLRARLELAYPERARLDAGAAAPAGWRAEVVMPVMPVMPAVPVGPPT